MKKAYVKPVFFAEEFVADSSYAVGTCTMSGGVFEIIPSTTGPKEEGTTMICNAANGNHWASIVVPYDKGGKDGYKENPNNVLPGLGMTWSGGPEGTEYTNYTYALESDGKAYLFALDNVVCDFLWNKDADGAPHGPVYVWNDIENKDRGGKDYTLASGTTGFFQFFTGKTADDKHIGQFIETLVPQSA